MKPAIPADTGSRAVEINRMDERPTKRRGPLLWLAAHVHPWQVGCLIGSAPPIAVAAYWMLHDSMYRAALPPTANSAYCGTGVGMMIIFVAPVCGTIGAAIGAIVAVFRRTE